MTTFAEIHIATLPVQESIQSAYYIEVPASVGADSRLTCKRRLFVIGTASTIPDDIEPSNGCIHIFEVGNSSATSSMSNTAVVSKVCEKTVKGSVFSLAEVSGKLVASIGSKVIIFPPSL